MSLLRAIRRRRFPVLPVMFVALAILNPYCCKFLPYFAADVLQTELNVEGEDRPCPGKPKAVRDEEAVVPPGFDFGMAGMVRMKGPRSFAAVPEPPSWLPAGTSLPRYKVLGVYRV
jgi:hypothetical protein